MALSDSAFHTTLRVHQLIYERTDGLIGHRVLGGIPSLLLRTTGRKSGQTRTNALIYAKDGGRYLVVASKGGSDQPPAWLLNLQAQPQVEVQIARKRRQATATVIEHDDPDYARVWKLVSENNGGRYDAYQRQTTRPIPVVALTPDA
jgi:F420H(2)-dependent quinone reductase